MIEGSNFQQLIEKTGLSVSEIAELTGYTERTVYRWESGKSKPRKAILDLLYRIADSSVGKNLNEKADFTFIDLFAGIGGIRKGFESIGGKCVFTSEWNRFSRQTYLANFGCDHSIAGDITKVDEADIPTHDVLLAGFPCQPFSIAGVSKKKALGREHGFRDKTQGTLFFDVARIIAHHQPRAFLLENVKNLVSHDKGNTFRVIRDTLEELGYYCDYRVIDTKGFVPQHRERIFVAGFKEDTGFSFDNIKLPEIENGPRLGMILHPEDGSEEAEPPYTRGDLAEVDEKYTLSPKLWQYLKDYAEKHRKKGNGFGYGLFDRNGVARTLSARYYKDGSEILIKQGEKDRPRRLTPRECARLMGFDLPGSPQFEIPVSDTQAYRQFGNAVVVPVIEAIAQHMKPHIMGQMETLPGQIRMRFQEEGSAYSA